MKLLIITQKVDKDDPILGFFYRWIDVFSKNCESIVVICLYKGKNELPNNVKVLSLGKEIRESRIRYIINFYKYIWIERKNYDSVFVHMNQIYVILGGVFWKLYNKNISLWYTHRSVTKSLRIATLIVDKIFTASKESFRLKSNKINVMGHGIDVDIFKPLNFNKNGNEFKIVSVGRFTQSKGYEFMIDAVNTIKSNRKITCEFWGEAVMYRDVEYVEKLNKKIETSPNNTFEMKGKVSQDKLCDILNSADLFLNMSDTGSLDKAILEAMASGTIVITSNPAFEKIFSNHPFLFTNRNADDLAKSINKVLMLDSKNKSINDYYVKYVNENHSLKLLIPRIITNLNK